MHLVINSVTIAKFELGLNEFFDVHFVTFEFAGLFTVYDMIIFG